MDSIKGLIKSSKEILRSHIDHTKKTEMSSVSKYKGTKSMINNVRRFLYTKTKNFSDNCYYNIYFATLLIRECILGVVHTVHIYSKNDI